MESDPREDINMVNMIHLNGGDPREDINMVNMNISLYHSPLNMMDRNIYLYREDIALPIL